MTRLPKARILLAAASVAFMFTLAVLPGVLRAANYHETFEPGEDPSRIMAGVLLLGEQDGWSGKLADGAYHLANASKDGALRYFFVNPHSPPTSLEVKVAGQYDGKYAGAGLLYGVDKAAGTYYAFLVSRDGRYTVLQRTPNGLHRIASGSNDAIRGDGENTLSVRFEGNAVQHYVNNSKMMGFGAKAPVNGGVGIIAVDRGSYSFDDFGFTEQ